MENVEEFFFKQMSFKETSSKKMKMLQLQQRDQFV